MKPAAVALVCAGLAQAAWPAPQELPPLAALLSHEVRETGADGVTRTSEYRERYFRSGDRVWIAREIPGWTRALPVPDAHELNINTASRLIQRKEGNGAELWLVDEAHRTRYAVAPSQRERTAFSGRWDLEAMLIDPAELAQLGPGRAVPAATGVQRYEQRKHGQILRILWNPQQQFPQLIETGHADGRAQTRTRVTLLPLPKSWPWDELSGYADRELSDLDD